MRESFATFVKNLQQELTSAHEARLAEGAPPLATLHVTILGQTALRIHPHTAPLLNVIQTADLAALLSGDWTGKRILQRCLATIDLVYDEHSNEAWIPPEATFTELYRSDRLIIKALDPLWCLVSKAVKAPAKNRYLIQEAIAIYGEELVSLISRAGGSPILFVDEK
jgi:hypothetical protein